MVRSAWPASKSRSSDADFLVQFLGEPGRFVHQLGRAVPLGDGRADLGDRTLLRLLIGHHGPPVLGLALEHQGFAVVPDRQRADQDKPDVLHARLVHRVLRTDDRRGDSVPFRQTDGGMRSVDQGIGGVNIGAACSASWIMTCSSIGGM